MALERVNDKKWFKNENGFYVKEMKYQNSCFPCSLHVLLANLGREGLDERIEDLWNEFSGNTLNTSAPNETQVATYFKDTQLGDGVKLITPSMFSDKDVTKNFLDESIDRMMNFENSPAGLVIGVEHATVIFKDARGKYYYYFTSQKIEGYFVEEIEIGGMIWDRDTGSIVVKMIENEKESVVGGTFVALVY